MTTSRPIRENRYIYLHPPQSLERKCIEYNMLQGLRKQQFCLRIPHEKETPLLVHVGKYPNKIFARKSEKGVMFTHFVNELRRNVTTSMLVNSKTPSIIDRITKYPHTLAYPEKQRKTLLQQKPLDHWHKNEQQHFLKNKKIAKR